MTRTEQKIPARRPATLHSASWPAEKEEAVVLFGVFPAATSSLQQNLALFIEDAAPGEDQNDLLVSDFSSYPSDVIFCCRHLSFLF